MRDEGRHAMRNERRGESTPSTAVTGVEVQPAGRIGPERLIDGPPPFAPWLADGALRAIDDAAGPSLVPHITRATVADAEAILRLQHEAYQSEARLYNDWLIPPLVQTLDELIDEFATTTVLKGHVDGRLVGSVRASESGGVVQIARLIVAPDLQGRGIGSALLRAIEASFPAATCFELFTGSLSVDNIRLYRRHGYHVVREEVLGPTVILVFMRKTRD